MLFLVNLCNKKQKYCFQYLLQVVNLQKEPFAIIKSQSDIPLHIIPSAIILSGSPIRLTKINNNSISNSVDKDLINLATSVHKNNPGVPILGIQSGPLYYGTLESIAFFKRAPSSRISIVRVRG